MLWFVCEGLVGDEVGSCARGRGVGKKEIHVWGVGGSEMMWAVGSTAIACTCLRGLHLRLPWWCMVYGRVKTVRRCGPLRRGGCGEQESRLWCVENTQVHIESGIVVSLLLDLDDVA